MLDFKIPSIEGSTIEQGVGTPGLTWQKENSNWGNFGKPLVARLTTEEDVANINEQSADLQLVIRQSIDMEKLSKISHLNKQMRGIWTQITTILGRALETYI